MSLLPTGDVTFLFSDMEGPTRLWERFPETMPAVLARQDTLFTEAVTAGAIEADWLTFTVYADGVAYENGVQTESSSRLAQVS